MCQSFQKSEIGDTGRGWRGGGVYRQSKFPETICKFKCIKYERTWKMDNSARTLRRCVPSLVKRRVSVCGEAGGEEGGGG